MQESQRQDHIEALQTLQEENAKLQDEISRQIVQLEEGREKLNAEKGHSSELNAQLDAALSAKLEMEAQLGSASDERKSLLERCLLAENELERSRGTVLELRRKLDDSQAALHELGRENQSIQVSKVVARDFNTISPTSTMDVFHTRHVRRYSLSLFVKGESSV